MAALPTMTKEEKKALQTALQDEEDKDIEKRRQLHKNLMAEWSHYDDYKPTAPALQPGRPEERAMLTKILLQQPQAVKCLLHQHQNKTNQRQ